MGTSNIIPNELRFDLVGFKSLTKLVLSNVDCCPEKIESISHVRKSLVHLEASDCKLTRLTRNLLRVGTVFDREASLTRS